MKPAAVVQAHVRLACRGALPDCAQGVCLDARSVTAVMPQGPQHVSTLLCWQQFCNVDSGPILAGCWVVPAVLTDAHAG